MRREHPRLRTNELYPLRIIGLNQDEKASGGMAGLTFIFTKPIKTDGYAASEGSIWENSDARSYLNSGAGWTGLRASVQGAIEMVKKISVSGDMGWGDKDTWQIANTQDKLFFMSYKEHSLRTSVLDEPIGVGADKKQCYMIFTEGPIRNPQDLTEGKQAWCRDNLHISMVYRNNSTLNAPTWGYYYDLLGYHPCFCF